VVWFAQIWLRREKRRPAEGSKVGIRHPPLQRYTRRVSRADSQPLKRVGIVKPWRPLPSPDPSLLVGLVDLVPRNEVIHTFLSGLLGACHFLYLFTLSVFPNIVYLSPISHLVFVCSCQLNQVCLQYRQSSIALAPVAGLCVRSFHF